MGFLRSVVLYTALALSANAAMADMAALEPLRQGDMRKLAFAETPKPLPDVVLLDETGAEHRLSDFRGQHLLVNFWATWCAPCREEMPSLERLQGELGGDAFRVVTVATGRSDEQAINRFFQEIGVSALPKLRDPKMELARSMGVLGLPVSVIVDPEGREIARLIGDAHWDGPEAKALIGALIQ